LETLTTELESLEQESDVVAGRRHHAHALGVEVRVVSDGEGTATLGPAGRAVACARGRTGPVAVITLRTVDPAASGLAIGPGRRAPPVVG
jgi:hypothetical protein